MIKSFNRLFNRLRKTEFARKYIGFISSIYGRVVLIIVGSFIILLILLNFVFRSLYADYFNSTLRQSGDNMSSIVERAIYYSMLENDKFVLQRTLDVISTMSGIDEVSLYDHLDSLAYTSTQSRLEQPHDPDGVPSTDDLISMFPEEENSYRIVEHADIGEKNHRNTRQLLIRKPIMNERSCYTADCHAHTENEVVLGTLIIKLPLEDLDSVVDDTIANHIYQAKDSESS